MAGPGDEITAGPGGGGRLRASHADREQVIGTLKAAFVHGMLAKDEFDQRVGQAFAARTHAELAAVTADLPAALTTAQPPTPAQVPGEARVLRPGPVLTAATALYAGIWAFALLAPLPKGSDGDSKAAAVLVFTTSLVYLCVLVIAVGFALADRREKRSGGQPPRRPGGGGQAACRLPPAGPDRKLPPGDHGHRRVAEAARSRRPHRRRVCAEAALRPS